MSTIFLTQRGKCIHPSERFTAKIIKKIIRKAKETIDNKISKMDSIS